MGRSHNSALLNFECVLLRAERFLQITDVGERHNYLACRAPNNLALHCHDCMQDTIVGESCDVLPRGKLTSHLSCAYLRTPHRASHVV